MFIFAIVAEGDPSDIEPSMSEAGKARTDSPMARRPWWWPKRCYLTR